MSMVIFIRAEDCTGCGMCEVTCPEMFRLVDEVATVLHPEGLPEFERGITTAINHCLGSCIVREEA
jgi:ferredoxin